MFHVIVSPLRRDFFDLTDNGRSINAYGDRVRGGDSIYQEGNRMKYVPPIIPIMLLAMISVGCVSTHYDPNPGKFRIPHKILRA